MNLLLSMVNKFGIYDMFHYIKVLIGKFQSKPKYIPAATVFDACCQTYC